MDAIKDLNASSGQAIMSILPPTFKIFAPLLLSNNTLIKSHPATESSYGTHPRQKLDLFTPSSPSPNSPILIFLHGGGLIRGDKNSPQMPQNLVYANVGAFFAERGITTCNMNYRRANSGDGGEGAVFPSGGEDVAEALKWAVSEFGGKGQRDVFLLGNSAGGIHASTFVLGSQFLEQRKSLYDGKDGIRLRGLIDVAVPTHFTNADAMRGDVLKTYYGDVKDVEEKCVLGLLEQVKKSGVSREEAGIPECLALLGEFDPEDEIGGPMKDFVSLWKETFGGAIEMTTLMGHNHISPPMALCSGDLKGENWGEYVADWVKKMSA